MSSGNRGILRSSLRALIGVAIAGVVLFAIFLVVRYVVNRPPEAIRQVVERRLPAIRAFAERTAARCPEIKNSGLQAQIAGAVPTSPASGSELEGWPELAQVDIACMWWQGAPGGAASGNNFVELRQVQTRQGSSDGHWRITQGILPGRSDPMRGEDALWPSFLTTENEIDVTVRRPLAHDAGYIEVRVALRR